MEKNVYQILQDWHELLKSGVITDEEFATKKNELLGEEKKSSPQEKIHILSKEEEPQTYEAYDTTYEELFMKPKWYKRSRYWIGFFVLCLAVIVAWFINSEGEDLNQVTIISDLNAYCIKEFKNEKKTKGTSLYEDRKYIDSFYSKITKGDYGETLLEFYAKYSRYPDAWKLENNYKLEQCLSSYTFNFDTTNLNDDNRYTESKISKFDINKDNKTDYIVDGYFSDCSGGSGSEGRYFLTYINNGATLELKDVLITSPLEHTIYENELIVSGKYKSWFVESIYNFDKDKNKWIYNESESGTYSRDK